MNIETFRAYCLSLPGTTEEIKWGVLCFMVEKKIFVLLSIDSSDRLSLKCDPEEFDELTARDGIAQAYHLAKRRWVQIENFDVVNHEELKQRVQNSRALVISKFPKKLQAKYS